MGYSSVRKQVYVMAIMTFMLLLGFKGDISEGCLKEEREGLLRLKKAFNYLNGDSFPSWNNLITTNCCTWERVQCDNSTHRVIVIDLSSARPNQLGYLQWSLSASYFNPFQHLQELDLSGNYLSGLFGDIKLANMEVFNSEDNMLTEFPSFDISHSRNLKLLELDNNMLEGSIPESITSLTSVIELSLHGNKLTGPLPQQGGLCNMKNLQVLNIDSNKFEGKLPSCLGNLTSLRTLYLGKNNFQGTFPSTIFHPMSSLVAVVIDGNYFSGSIPLSSLANHTNLKGFVILCNNDDNGTLKIETESPPFIPSFQLRVFRIRYCSLNEATNNKMPTFLLHQYELAKLELSHLNISETFPSWLLTNNTKLRVFAVNHNLLSGPFQLNSTTKLLQMEFFDISSNPIGDEMPLHIGHILPNLSSLSMRSASLRGSIPASIGEMRQLNDIDLANNNLSGYLPPELCKGINQLRILKLSNNSLSGPCLPIWSNFTYLLILALNNNNFIGKFPREIINSTELTMLDLSANQLWGEIPDWIGNLQRLSYLILSKNSLSSSLPESFCNLSQLTYLDLSHNKFNDFFPNCLKMPLLKYLHLQSNQFMGSLPSTLANSPSLMTLNLMNKFSGQIPRIVGSFFSLRVLMLKENKLEGPIPIYLCELKNISLLDLSQNKLSGSVPYCLSNITFGKMDGLGETEIGSLTVSWTIKLTQYFFDPFTGDEVTPPDESKLYVTLYREQEVDFTTKWRYESYKGSILNFMSGLDLSNNHLTGEIPLQIGYLSAIHALNLSNNQLKGPIPETFASLKQIESLDLSHNKLTGHIPTQLIQLYALSVFSVAHNNLSGMTPDIKAQFSTFGSSSYEGNPFLCGPPLHQKCSSIDRPKTRKHEADDFRASFLWSFVGAFGIFFLSVIIVLYLNPYVCNYKLLLLERAITSYLYEWWQNRRAF